MDTSHVVVILFEGHVSLKYICVCIVDEVPYLSAFKIGQEICLGSGGVVLE
jgi:hypothetical protein